MLSWVACDGVGGPARAGLLPTVFAANRAPAPQNTPVATSTRTYKPCTSATVGIHTVSPRPKSAHSARASRNRSEHGPEPSADEHSGDQQHGYREERDPRHIANGVLRTIGCEQGELADQQGGDEADRESECPQPSTKPDARRPEVYVVAPHHRQAVFSVTHTAPSVVEHRR